jgi:adenylate cyclase class IV
MLLFQRPEALVGATSAGRKGQVDYFFVLPEDERGPRRQRLELRTDDEGQRLIYYYDRAEPDSRSVNFVIAEVGGASARKLLEAALGVRAIVRKRRETWRKENTRFNLDEVEGAGTIVEVEVEGVDTTRASSSRATGSSSRPTWGLRSRDPMRTWSPGRDRWANESRT